MQITAILTPAEEGGYVAFNPETGTATQGENVEEALTNLREAVELYLEEFPLNFTATPFVTTIAIAEHA
jgi:predicted RNase H-like HicB family nuclease